VLRLPALLASALVLVATALPGCGDGVSAGATVHVYAAASLCRDARAELARAGGEAGDLEVRLVCLPATGSGGRSDLAIGGANARRAAEDSTTVAFLEAAGPTAKFSRSILEAADIAVIVGGDGQQAMARVLTAIRDGSPEEPRQAVLDAVEG